MTGEGGMTVEVASLLAHGRSLVVGVAWVGGAWLWVWHVKTLV